jgi:hypothetical protein
LLFLPSTTLMYVHDAYANRQRVARYSVEQIR